MTVQCVVSRISAREDTTVDPEGFVSGLCSSTVNMIIRTGYEAMKAKSDFPAQKENTNISPTCNTTDTYPCPSISSEVSLQKLLLHLGLASTSSAAAILHSHPRNRAEFIPAWRRADMGAGQASTTHLITGYVRDWSCLQSFHFTWTQFFILGSKYWSVLNDCQ